MEVSPKCSKSTANTQDKTARRDLNFYRKSMEPERVIVQWCMPSLKDQYFSHNAHIRRNTCHISHMMRERSRCIRTVNFFIPRTRLFFGRLYSLSWCKLDPTSKCQNKHAHSNIGLIHKGQIYF